MTYKGILLALNDGNTDRRVGLGLLCPEAATLSVKWAAAERIERPSVSAGNWSEIADQLIDALGSTTAESISPSEKALIAEARSKTQDLIRDLVVAPAGAVRVEWLSVLLVNVPQSKELLASLDALLLSIVDQV